MSLVLAPSCVSAQSKQKKKAKERIVEFLNMSDSLRRVVRHAADGGELLQWADSMYRAHAKDGDIDSAKYAKLRSKLSMYDGKLFRVDSLLAESYKKKNIDSLYITRPEERWTIKLRVNVSGSDIEATGNKGTAERNIDMKSEYRGTLSASVAYRGLTLGLAMNPAKLAGKNKDFEFNMNSYGNRYGFDIIYQSANTYSGTQKLNGVSTDIVRGLVSHDALNLNFYYVFNYKRFSFPAAFSQSYIQRRSAGSFMLGASLEGSSLEIQSDEANTVSPMKLKMLEFCIGAGYGYNFVPGRHWLLHLSALPTFSVIQKDKVEMDGEKDKMKYKFPSPIITGRGAAVYSWRNKFAGVSMVYNISVIGDEDYLQVKRSKWRLRSFFGFRF